MSRIVQVLPFSPVYRPFKWLTIIQSPLVMLQTILRRSVLSRSLSNGRAPGRIFGNYDQAVAENLTSSNFDSPLTSESSSRRNATPLPSTDEVASIAFSEEAMQDYTLPSFKDASSSAFSQEISSVLSEPVDEQLIEIKPDGSCYLPEVHYRKTLNKAFGLGGWSLIPRGPHSIQGNVLSREYALFADGRFISQARGHSTITGAFQNPAMCTESVRSNSLMRCCKDLGIASDLWDNSITAQWKARFAIRKSVTDYQGRTKNIWEKKRSEQY